MSINGTPDMFSSTDLDRTEADEADFWDELVDNCDEHPQYGIQCVREDSFTNYTINLIDECYPNSPAPEGQRNNWPYRHITYNYEAAAEELKDDYAELEFRGTTYFCR